MALRLRKSFPLGSAKLERDVKVDLYTFQRGRERFCNYKFYKVDSLKNQTKPKKKGHRPIARREPS